MQALGVTASQINSALRQININAAGGRAEVGGTRQSVRVLGNADDAYALSQTQISLRNGQTVKLSDVAEVTDSFGERSSISKVRGVEVVNFSMSRARGASDVTVFDDAMVIMNKIEAEVPGIEFIPLFNSVKYTKSQYKSSMLAMIEGAILAVVVVFIFLRDWRATVISAIAIPLSAIPTFWFMDLLGFNLNFLSLLALGLVAGVLVDDAIVEIENIVRHMRMGKTAYQASIDAADEIGLAVVATSFCIVAVFLPVGLMPGISGQFFKNFGITVVISVLMSLAVARMITPMVAAYFLKAHGHAEHGEGVWMDRYMRLLEWVLDRTQSDKIRETLVPAKASWWHYMLGFVLFTLIVAAFIGAAFGVGTTVFGLLETLIPSDFLRALLSLVFGIAVGLFIATLVMLLLRFIVGVLGGRFADWYAYRSGRYWARAHDHRMWMMATGILSFVLTVILFAITPMEFQPSVNEDNSRVEIEVVPGTTLEQTEKIADQVSDLMYAQPEVERVLTRVRETNATVFVSFKEEREKTSIEFERSLSPELQKIPDARISFRSQNGGGGTGRAISIMLTGSDPILLDATAAQLVEQMKDVDLVRAPRIAADLSRPEIIITPHMDLASQLGVTTAALSQTIRIATLGEIDQNAAKFSLSDRQIPIRVMLPLESRTDLTTIENLPIPIASGGTVPLNRVATVSFGSGPTSIQRYNQNRRTFVGADLAPDVIKGDAMTAIFDLPIMKNLPTGVSNEAFGEDEWQQEMLVNFGIALIAGILLVFATLVLLYKRLMSPLVNMGSLALAPLGGMLFVWAAGASLSMPVLIGMLMLLGIVSKNSILLIDFAIEEMQKGVPKFEAIMDAGHKRAQPIVMTTVAMTAGMVPTALSLSGDGAWRAPMGIVVIGGLIVSTLLTLVIVPAGFSLADGFERRAGPWLRNKMLTYKPGDDRHDRPDAGVQPAE
ncbi:MAG: efflux RND transporter permease subunit, partial [Parasphingorhabdus sp.]